MKFNLDFLVISLASVFALGLLIGAVLMTTDSANFHRKHPNYKLEQHAIKHGTAIEV